VKNYYFHYVINVLLNKLRSVFILKMKSNLLELGLKMKLIKLWKKDILLRKSMKRKSTNLFKKYVNYFMKIK